MMRYGEFSLALHRIAEHRRIPVNGVRSIAALVLPGGSDRAAERGLREQKALLRTMIGGDQATIGASASHLRGVA